MDSYVLTVVNTKSGETAWGSSDWDTLTNQVAATKQHWSAVVTLFKSAISGSVDVAFNNLQVETRWVHF